MDRKIMNIEVNHKNLLETIQEKSAQNNYYVKNQNNSISRGEFENLCREYMAN